LKLETHRILFTLILFWLPQTLLIVLSLKILLNSSQTVDKQSVGISAFGRKTWLIHWFF